MYDATIKILSTGILNCFRHKILCETRIDSILLSCLARWQGNDAHVFAYSLYYSPDILAGEVAACARRPLLLKNYKVVQI